MRCTSWGDGGDGPDGGPQKRLLWLEVFFFLGGGGGGFWVVLGKASVFFCKLVSGNFFDVIFDVVL